jgi:hypothetical protein
MPNVRRRVERLERFLAPEPASDPYGGILLLALQGLSEEDLIALEDVTGQGKREWQWTEREAGGSEGAHWRVRAGSAARGISFCG